MVERQQLGTGTDVAREMVLRPHRHLFMRGLVAVLALTTPVFAVLYWLTVPSGTWPLVLAAHIVAIVVLVLGVYSYFSTTITVGPEGVRERAFPGRSLLVRPGQAGTVLLVQLYEGSTLDTLPQLFVTDERGRILFRMRGQFWTIEDMERVAEELEVPVTRPEESMTMTQFRRTSPHLLSWFERLPGVGG